MKVTSVDIYASNSSSFINLSFKDPRGENSFNVKAILGLDADEIIAKFYGDSGVFDERYYELSMKKRDVIVQISLKPKYSEGQTPATLRDELYKLIASSRTGAVQLRFNNGDDTVAAISGFVTKFEAVQFSKTPEVQMTINCSNAMLKALTEVNLDIAGLDPQDTLVTDNLSTAPHGFRFGVIFSDTIIDFSIQDELEANWAFEVNLTGSPLTTFMPGDEFHFSSEVNNRYLYMVRGLDIIQLVDRILPTSVWPTLFPGENHFICSESVVWDYIVHYPTYWGV